MGRLTGLDKFLLATLLPIYVVCLALHLREMARTGQAQPPVYAAPAAGSPYPIVGGVRFERGVRPGILEVGDRLIRVGDADLRGAGYVSFDAIALEQTGVARRAPLIFERAGERRTTVLEIPTHRIQWWHLPFTLGLVVLCVPIVLRSPGNRYSQLFFAGFVGFAIMQSGFYGGPRLQTEISHAIFAFFGPLSIGLLLLLAIRTPPDLPSEKRLPSWLALLGFLSFGVRLNYLLGGPLPTEWSSPLAAGSDAGFAVMGFAILTRNYRYAGAVGRRQMRWVLYGGYVGFLPMLLTLSAVGLGFAYGISWIRDAFEISGLLTTAFPLCIAIAIARANMFDIDRLISATASYSVAIAVVVGSIVAIAPASADLLARSTGLSPQAARLALTVFLVLSAVPLHRRLRPRIDRLFFPERLERERGIERLLRDLAQGRTAEDVLRLVGERLHAVLQPDGCAVYARAGPGLSPVFASGAAKTPALLATSPLFALLERDPSPAQADDLLARAGDELGREGRRELERLGAALVVPIRRGLELAAVVFLGRRRSGDIYTHTDLTLLGAVAEKTGGELARLRDAAELEAERDRSKELAALKEAAEGANLAKSRFLAAASHDLRQPLHALGLFVETLAEQVEDDETRALVEQVETSTGALGRMFEQLLDVSRLDAGAIEPKRANTELAPLLRRLASEAEPLAREKGLDLRVEIAEASAQTDAVLLERIVQNLLTNALRYTSRGEVRVVARGDGDEVEIRIADTGPGIPPAHQREIFREFVQLQAGDGQGGLGLGLAIVDRLCQLLGHALSLHSDAGGTEFTLRLPRARTAAASAPRRPSDAGLAGRRVLIVEDDAAIREGMEQALARGGCAVASAGSLEEALESAAGAAPDAIVVDYRLRQGRSGLEAIEALRAAWGELPALVLTGETGPEALREIQERGLPHLAKPAPPAAVRAALARLLGGGPSPG